MADDDVSKLAIYGLGIAIIAFFGYLIYREIKQSTQPITMAAASPSHHPAELNVIEQKLIQLENKIDTFQKSSTLQSLSSKQQSEQPERNTVSLSNRNFPTRTMKLTDAELTKLTQMKFDMR